MSSLPVFTLDDPANGTHSFPTGRPALLCFVKEDCPTCGLSMPLIEQAHRAFGDAVDVWAVGQETEGNATLVSRHGLTLPMLDDSALLVSYEYDLDTVPTVILTDREGNEQRRFIGFGRRDWQDMYAELGRVASAAQPNVDWSEYPDSLPGCGSRSVEPGIVERLAAEAEGSPIRARRIEIGQHDDEFEFMFDQGLTDGLPVVPPTPERVVRMLGATKRDPQEVIAVVPPNMAPCTIEKVAINAVMAGCKPEYLPVVIAAVEGACTDEFNAHGVMATTMGASPVMVLNGPVRRKLSMNHGISVLGPDNRANAALGRAVRLVLRNVGGAKPGGTQRSTLGNPGQYTFSFPEWEERSPWEPMHVERGFGPEDSVVTLFALTGGPLQIVDQNSRDARALVGSLGLSMRAVSHPKTATGDVLLVLSPEHVDTIWQDDRWSKEQIRNRIQEAGTRPLRELLRDAESGAGYDPATFGPNGPTKEQLDERMPKFHSKDSIHIVIAGSDAGKWSAVIAGWASGPTGSIPTSRKIEEV